MCSSVSNLGECQFHLWRKNNPQLLNNSISSRVHKKPEFNPQKLVVKFFVLIFELVGVARRNVRRLSLFCLLYHGKARAFWSRCLVAKLLSTRRHTRCLAAHHWGNIEIRSYFFVKHCSSILVGRPANIDRRRPLSLFLLRLRVLVRIFFPSIQFIVVFLTINHIWILIYNSQIRLPYLIDFVQIWIFSNLLESLIECILL